MEVAVERPPVKEEKRVDTKPEMATIGSALPIVFESFQSPSMKQEGGSRLEAARAEMGEVREENERLKAELFRIVNDYKSLQMHFLDVVKVHDEKQAATKATNLPVEPAPTHPVTDDDLVSLSLGTRSGANGATAGRKGHERSASSGSGTADEATADDDSHLSLGLGFARGGSRPSADDDDKVGPVLNLSSDSSSADGDAAKPAAQAAPAGESRKSPSGGAGDDEVQQQAKKARVSVRVKCDTPTMPDGCQWRKYGQKISKGNPCPRAYYRCTVAPNCPVRKQVQRCADDKAILITTYEGAHNHHLPPAATAMASTTSAAAAMLTAGSTTSSSSLGRHHLPAGLLGPTTMISTAASCPTITLDLTAPPHASSPLMMHHASSSSPYAGYESKALPAAWSSGYPAYGGQPSSYYAKMSSSPAMAGHQLFGGGLGLSRPAPEQQLFGGGHSSFLQRSTSLGAVAPPPAVTDTLAKALAADPSFQSVLATMITSYMGRSAGGEAAQK